MVNRTIHLGKTPTIIPVTFDPAKKASDFTLSNGNLTATCVAGTSISREVLGTTSHATGKYFFKMTAVELDGATGNQFGVSTALASYNANVGGANAPEAGIGVTPGGIAIFGNGSFGGFTDTGYPTYANGNVVSVAVDFDAAKIWWQVNGTGNWNKGAGADPASGTGGLSMSAFIALGPFFPAGNVNPANNVNPTVITADFSGSGAPSGFIAW